MRSLRKQNTTRFCERSRYLLVLIGYNRPYFFTLFKFGKINYKAADSKCGDDRKYPISLCRRFNSRFSHFCNQPTFATKMKCAAFHVNT